jgi:hypothetical protein
LNNVGANFSLQAYSTTGVSLGTWLSIARADGSTTFNGSGVTINGGLSVNGLLALASPNNLAIYGGSAGQFLGTNGAGILSWQTPPGAGGGIGDAPNDGTMYARISATWEHILHTDISDWATALSGYALTSSVPVASTTTPVMDGTAAVGTGTTWARADHVHPSDTSRYAASNPSGYQTAANVTAALAPYALTSSLPPASTVLPIIDGTAAIGVSTAYARADHVHPASAASGGDTVDIAYFGDGSDGAVSITTTVALTRDMYYSNLAISGAGILQTNGWRVFVSGVLDLSAAGAGAIAPNIPSTAGGNGASPTGGTSGFGRAGTFFQTLNGNVGGGGATAANGSATGGGPNSVLTPGALGGIGGSGGPGGTGTGTGIPGPGSSTAASAIARLRLLLTLPVMPLTTTAAPIYFAGGGGGSGGGGSGATNAVNGGGGGGGGGPAGAIFLWARTILRGAGTAAGVINLSGMNGGNGGPLVGGAGSGGGGGGGGGGFAYLVYRFLTGSTAINAINLSGGNGGNAGAGTAGQQGQGGQGGQAGYAVFCNIATDTITASGGAVGSGPTGISSVTGGLGGVGSVNL